MRTPRPVALVTGASRGIGRAVALALAGSGHDVAVHYRCDRAGAQSTAAAVADVGGTAMLVHADLGVDAPEDLLDAVTQGLGRLDVVVANAFPQDLGHDLATWDLMWTQGLRATAALLDAAADRLASTTAPTRTSGGVLVTIGSIEGLRPAPGHRAYAVAKAALHHLTAALAHDLGPRGIRVVGVAPGLTNRPGLDADWPDGIRRYAQASALGRPVEPEEVAAAVAFLASRDASGITGITLPVDAGWSAGPGW